VARAGVENDDDKGVTKVVSDLWQLVRDYARQETVDPLKSIGRFLMWGVSGAVLLALGVLFATLAVLRGLQHETGRHLTGSWNWVPYAVALVVDAIVLALALRAIKKPITSEER